MRSRSGILFLLTLVALTLVALLAAGCGGDSGATTSASTSPCTGSEPELVPPPAGKPQLAYFYRDT